MERLTEGTTLGAAAGAEGLLSLWLGLSALERQRFDEMRKTLEDSADFMRDAVHRQTESFQELASRSRQQSAQMQDVVAFAGRVELDGEAIPMTEAAAFVADVMQKIIGIVINLSRHAVSITIALDDVVTEVDAARRCVAMIDEINRTTNMIAINAKIEAHRAGEAGRAFNVVATEIRSLSVRVNSISQEINRRIAQVQNSVRDSHSTLREIASVDLSEHLLAKERLDSMLGALSAQSEQFQRLMNSALTAQTEMDRTIGAIVQSTQYEDVVRQRVDAVRHLMTQTVEASTTLSRLCGNRPAIAASELATRLGTPQLRGFFEGTTPAAPDLNADAGSIELF